MPICIDCLANAPGVTAFVRIPAQGAWVSADDSLEREEIVVLEVLTE